MFKRAYRVQTTSAAIQADDVELHAPAINTIAAQSLLHLVFYARSTGIGGAAFDAVFRSADTAQTESFHLCTTVDNNWTRFSHAFMSLDD
jgi:hypothetical protein